MSQLNKGDFITRVQNSYEMQCKDCFHPIVTYVVTEITLLQKQVVYRLIILGKGAFLSPLCCWWANASLQVPRKMGHSDNCPQARLHLVQNIPWALCCCCCWGWQLPEAQTLLLSKEPFGQFVTWAGTCLSGSRIVIVGQQWQSLFLQNCWIWQESCLRSRC